MFRSLSYAIFKIEECYRDVIVAVVKHIREIWLGSPRLRLTADEYIKSVNMDKNTTWGGSTELEAAAEWLNTPIKVYYYGNPKFPPRSWMMYGTNFPTASTHVILLQWTNGNHYDFVTELK